MKNLAILFAVFATTNNANAQVESSETITLTANLNTTLAMRLDNSGITFDFTTLEDYKDGLGGYESDYASKGAISSTANWNLSFKADSEMTHSDEKTTMPLNNIGLIAKFNGSNDVDVKAEKDAPLALTGDEQVILGHNAKSNAGDEAANNFVIFWEMGTKNGNLNNKSIFEQDLKKESYKTNVSFICREDI